MSIFLFTTALSYALGLVLTPVIKDPYLIWIWAGPSIALFVQTVIFWFRYRNMNEDEFMTYDVPEEKTLDTYAGSEAEGQRPMGEKEIEMSK